MSELAYRQNRKHRLRNPSTLVLIVLNVVVYFFLLRWVRENIHAEKLADYVMRIPVWALLGSLLIHLLALVLYGVRMSVLLGRDFRTAFSIINAGYALNTLLPLRVGEGIKLYFGHRLFAVPLTGVFTASVAEKLIDLVMILLFGSMVLAFAAGGIIQASTLISAGVVTLIAVGIVILFRRNVVRVVRFFPRGSRLRRISIALHKHSKEYRVMPIVSATLGIWILTVALIFFTFNTYLPELRIGLIDAIALLVVIALAIAIPSAPAGIGLFEAAVVAFLTQRTHIGNEAALAAASVFHLVISLPQVMLTAWLVWRRPAWRSPKSLCPSSELK